jgi:hypothetical protein
VTEMSGPRNVCQACGKRKQSYATRAAARRRARRSRSLRLRVYPCGEFFHLTSVPADRAAALRASERTAGD